MRILEAGMNFNISLILGLEKSWEFTKNILQRQFVFYYSQVIA